MGDPIYIFDNGMPYSDHAVYFLRSHWPADVTERAVLAEMDDSGASLIAIVEAIDWRDESEIGDVRRYLGTGIGRPAVRVVLGPERVRETIAFLRATTEPAWRGIFDACDRAEEALSDPEDGRG
jgi:hypothetical protein